MPCSISLSPEFPSFDILSSHGLHLLNLHGSITQDVCRDLYAPRFACGHPMLALRHNCFETLRHLLDSLRPGVVLSARWLEARDEIGWPICVPVRLHGIQCLIAGPSTGAHATMIPNDGSITDQTKVPDDTQEKSAPSA
ncbi:hypothetical protein KC345_g61 [Hortaea werneckii]|nr:hypothetical protein KC345_g61 [Hortaea werneckii]